MRTEVVGELIQWTIPLAGGLYACFLGFVVARKKDLKPKYDKLTGRNGQLLRILGPILVLVSLLLIGRTLVTN